MVNSAVLDKVYFSLADETRRGILIQLSKGDLAVSELAKPFKMSSPAISKHLKVLENAKLINRKVEGRKHMISLNIDSLTTAEDFISQLQNYWEHKLELLEVFLKEKEARK